MRFLFNSFANWQYMPIRLWFSYSSGRALKLHKSECVRASKSRLVKIRLRGTGVLGVRGVQTPPHWIFRIFWILCLQDIGCCPSSAPIAYSLNPKFSTGKRQKLYTNFTFGFSFWGTVPRPGPPGFPAQKLENSPAQYQNSRKFPFLKYPKTSHKRSFKSVNSSSFAGFFADCIVQDFKWHFFHNRTNHKQANSVLVFYY